MAYYMSHCTCVLFLQVPCQIAPCHIALLYFCCMYPVILSLENHRSIENQQAMAHYMSYRTLLYRTLSYHPLYYLLQVPCDIVSGEPL